MTAGVDILRRRLTGDYTVDEWGLDADIVELAEPMFRVRWRVSVDGAENLPLEGPVLVVSNRRVGVSEPLVLAHGLRMATGRFVRFLGVPDIAVVGPMLRRLGGALDRPDEVAGLLRAGHVVAAPLSPSMGRPDRAGTLRPESLAPALEHGVPIVPVATTGWEAGRRWRVVVGKPVPPPAGSGPLALAELADEATAGVRELLRGRRR
jgi:hypothetical protein